MSDFLGFVNNFIKSDHSNHTKYVWKQKWENTQTVSRCYLQ